MIHLYCSLKNRDQELIASKKLGCLLELTY